MNHPLQSEPTIGRGFFNNEIGNHYHNHAKQHHYMSTKRYRYIWPGLRMFAANGNTMQYKYPHKKCFLNPGY